MGDVFKESAPGVLTEYQVQQKIVAGLCRGQGFPDAVKSVRLIETHISWVLLAGRYAYKIKKSLDLGFLDFTGLEFRHRFCEEELRLNRRLAASLYIDVVPIGGSPDCPMLGNVPAIEYAVRMRRFSVGRELDKLLARHRVTPDIIDVLAAKIASFHEQAPPAAADLSYGTPALIQQEMAQNFSQLRASTGSRFDAVLSALELASQAEFSSCLERFKRRHALGMVRECHGDLHLGNIALVGKEPVPFDCIEFNPDFRWIDVMSEVAFLVMDLEFHRYPDFANRFLNDWLEATGDYDGVSVLRFYLAYRALVRAKISAIREAQVKRKASPTFSTCSGYLNLARRYFSRQPCLVITHGLPASGKSTFALEAAGRMGGIRIRSDVERKRLFGLSARDMSHSGLRQQIYSQEATQKTYARLLDLACGMLESGFPVVVDAAFLKQNERANFRALAREMQVPFAIVSLQANKTVLRKRIRERLRLSQDASEADEDVLGLLESSQQPLTGDELLVTVMVKNGQGKAVDDPWSRLRTILAATGRMDDMC